MLHIIIVATINVTFNSVEDINDTLKMIIQRLSDWNMQNWYNVNDIHLSIVNTGIGVCLWKLSNPLHIGG